MASKSKSSSVSRSIEFAKPHVIKASMRNGELQPPRRIYAHASPHSIGGVSMFDYGEMISANTAANFSSEEHVMSSAAAKLASAGFDILQISESTINIAGSPKEYERAFGAPIVVVQRDVIKEGSVEAKAEFLECHNSPLPGMISVKSTEFEHLIEGIALEEPRYAMGANPFAPTKEYWHLDVPAGVSLACNADRAHRAGITGKGVSVAMVDSGWFRHPFFTARGYRSDTAILGPAASNPTADESGHGTGESANIFANAPDVRLRPVKMNFVNTIGAFNAAVGLDPDIITCSWGSSIEDGPLSAANIVLANAVAAAVASGIVVIFSAGNGHWGFPGQHPDVISAGGVYLDEDNNLRASDYASGFASKIYRGRNVPDLSGIVGMMPHAMNIMLPVEPSDSIDRGNSGGTHPNGDETANNDGWASFSGTSAAAPQLAGVAALVKQACNRLTPAEIRQIMMQTARDVTTGNCHSAHGHPATVGPDLATGHGLVDAHRASLMARLRCFKIGPIPPRGPAVPIQPRGPIIPVPPRGPIIPIPPRGPIMPVQPIRPVRPIGPEVGTHEEVDVRQLEPQQNADQTTGMDLTEEELDTIEDMVNMGQVDPDSI